MTVKKPVPAKRKHSVVESKVVIKSTKGKKSSDKSKTTTQKDHDFVKVKTKNNKTALVKVKPKQKSAYKEGVPVSIHRTTFKPKVLSSFEVPDNKLSLEEPPDFYKKRVPVPIDFRGIYTLNTKKKKPTIKERLLSWFLLQ